MKLIEVVNFELKVADEALLIKPIRKLWHQDRSDKKEKFYQQMAYMYHMIDPRSGYIHLADDNQRKQAIIEEQGLPADFKPSELLLEAMDIYKKQTTTMSQKLLRSSINGANKVSEFLDDVDLTAEDDKGRPKYQVSAITQALKNVEGIVTSLQNLQKKVDQELEEKGKARGAQELTIGDMSY